jgi:hypothetical protein
MRISTLQKEKTMSNLGIGLQMTGSTIHQECYSIGPGPDHYKVKGRTREESSKQIVELEIQRVGKKSFVVY